MRAISSMTVTFMGTSNRVPEAALRNFSYTHLPLPTKGIGEISGVADCVDNKESDTDSDDDLVDIRS